MRVSIGRSVRRERASLGLEPINDDRYYATPLVEELGRQLASAFGRFRSARASYDAWMADSRPAAPSRHRSEVDSVTYKARWEDGPRADKIQMIYALQKLEALLAIRAAGLGREREFRCGRRFGPDGQHTRCEVHTIA